MGLPAAGRPVGSVYINVIIGTPDSMSKVEADHVTAFWVNGAFAGLFDYWNLVRVDDLQVPTARLARAAQTWFRNTRRASVKTRGGVAQCTVKEFVLLVFETPGCTGRKIAEVDALTGRYKTHRPRGGR